MSERWKDLERATAAALGGERVTTPWFLFNERPDVLVPLPDGRRLVIDTKAYKRFSLHRMIEAVKSKYCTGEDIPAIVTREPRKEAYVTIPLAWLADLLNRVRGMGAVS